MATPTMSLPPLGALALPALHDDGVDVGKNVLDGIDPELLRNVAKAVVQNQNEQDMANFAFPSNLDRNTTGFTQSVQRCRKLLHGTLDTAVSTTSRYRGTMTFLCVKRDTTNEITLYRVQFRNKVHFVVASCIDQLSISPGQPLLIPKKWRTQKLHSLLEQHWSVISQQSKHDETKRQVNQMFESLKSNAVVVYEDLFIETKKKTWSNPYQQLLDSIYDDSFTISTKPTEDKQTQSATSGCSIS